MKTSMIGLAATLMASAGLAAPAMAQSFSKPFVEIGAGVAQIGDVKFGAQTVDSGRNPVGKLSGGFENVFGQLGLQVDYFTNSIDTALFEETNVETLTVSVVYTLPVSDWLDVYGGAGAGAAFFDYNGQGIGSQFPGVQSDDVQLVGQALAGVRAQLFGSPISLFIEAQYQISGDYEITPTASGEYHAFSGTAGLRWNF